MDLLPPPPPSLPGDHAPQGGTDHGARQRANAKPKIPSIEELLDKILKLSAPLLMGLISKGQADLILKSLKIALDVQLKTARPTTQGLPQEVLAGLLQSRPELIHLLEPYLSDEQVHWFMGQEVPRP